MGFWIRECSKGLKPISVILEKGGSGLAELFEQIDQLQRIKNRSEKERSALQRQLETGQGQLDDDSKQRMEMERRSKNFEGQLLELRLKTDEQSRQLQVRFNYRTHYYLFIL